MNLDQLKELGLSKGEINVYTALLDLGNSGLNNIQEKTGIERRNIYDILNKLIEKGFISYIIEKGKKTFQITNPSKIIDEIRKKQASLELLQEKIPQINELFNVSKVDIGAEVYRGNESMKNLLTEILDYKESYWLGGNNFNQMKSITKEMVRWFNHWMNKRIEQKHCMYDLIQRGTILEGLYYGHTRKQKKNYLEVRRLPKDFISPMVIIIFGNKVAQVLWSKQPFAFVMNSDEINKSFMNYFNYFWKISK